MEKLLKVLKNVNAGIDYENEKALITNRVIDSIDMTTLLADLEDAFDIEIDMEDIKPENFDSVEAMWSLVQELQE